MLEIYQICLISLMLAAVGVILWNRLSQAMRRVIRAMSLEDCSSAAGSWLDSCGLIHSLFSWRHVNRPPPLGVLVVCPMPVDTYPDCVVIAEEVPISFPLRVSKSSRGRVLTS
ncbi:hypothetical protein Pla144_39950 [Bythopirellula polymerisocia]|uniref:Uncharacterized protein n=1 Tax=Bythopirellula polymerisocia TaxID=2528003 RepID=A0A5C6CLV8_9BACT|nr:hypothetical protein Pla144_39950 [Bythopirellula polymerisocia]